VLAGITVDELAAALGVSDNEVRRIRREQSNYDPVIDGGTPRQLGEWGSLTAAAIATGTTPRQLGLRRVDAAAAGVTVL
jgi:hypothetical protein